MDFAALASSPRLLLQVQLRPVQGSRFQPTGFPDLGAAVFRAAGTEMLLVESAQSMANRLEAVCWDDGEDDLVSELRGLPFVRAQVADGVITNSILEAHRLNSPFICRSREFKADIEPVIGFEKNKPFDRRKLASALLRFDPNSLVHGIFLEKVGGVVRLPRILTAFIEAKDVELAPSGGVKFDRIQPVSTGESTPYGKAAEGYGNVPFQRDEFTGEITAFFNLDLALVRGLGLPVAGCRLLIGLSLYKIRRFLDVGLRLRTACDLEMDRGEQDSVQARRPEGFELPPLAQLRSLLPKLIADASPLFNDPRVLTVNYDKKVS